MCRQRVIQSPVGIFLWYFIVEPEALETAARKICKQRPGNLQSINSLFFKSKSVIDCAVFYKAVVKHNIMAQKRQLPAECHKPRDRVLYLRHALYHILRDSGQLCDPPGNHPFRINEGAVTVHNHSVYHPGGTYFQYSVRFWGQACGLQIQSYICIHIVYFLFFFCRSLYSLQ